MPSYSPVVSAARTLDLLVALNERTISSVDQLHRQTGLPKATVVRLLQTLVALGFVTNDRRQGGYQVTSQVQSLSCGFHGHPMVIEASRIWAIGLTQRHKWPVSIAMLDQDQMIVRFSTISDSAISPFHGTINRRLSLVSRALGRAYLAFCPPQERTILIDMLVQSGRAEDDLGSGRTRLLKTLALIRRRGYALRDPLVEPRNSNTLAVPIFKGDRVVATLGLTYYSSALRNPAAFALLVTELREAAAKIGDSVQALDPHLAPSDLAAPHTG